jgi:hypothetical protein
VLDSIFVISVPGLGSVSVLSVGFVCVFATDQGQGQGQGQGQVLGCARAAISRAEPGLTQAAYGTMQRAGISCQGEGDGDGGPVVTGQFRHKPAGQRSHGKAMREIWEIMGMLPGRRALPMRLYHTAEGVLAR